MEAVVGVCGASLWLYTQAPALTFKGSRVDQNIIKRRVHVDQIFGNSETFWRFWDRSQKILVSGRNAPMSLPGVSRAYPSLAITKMVTY